MSRLSEKFIDIFLTHFYHVPLIVSRIVKIWKFGIQGIGVFYGKRKELHAFGMQH